MRRPAWLLSVLMLALSAAACGRRASRSARVPGRNTTTATHQGAMRPSPTHTPVDATAAFRRQVERGPARHWVGTKDLLPAVTPGPLGSWDDFQVGTPVVLAQDGGSYAMWYRGCHLAGAEYGCAVGHATSKDGILWQRDAEPVFVPPDAFDRAHLEAIAVAKGADDFVLWYSVASSYSPEHRHATLHRATSRDGVAWTLQPDAVYTAVIQGGRLWPAALWRDGRFHLWLMDSRSPLDPATGRFPDMPSDGDDAILHFVSTDGGQLEPAGAAALAPLQVERGPLWVACDASGRFRGLLYEPHPSGRNSQGVAVLRSRDGSTWERSSDDAMPLSVNGLDPRGAPGALAAMEAPGGLLAWFTVRSNRGAEYIRAAFWKTS